MKRAAVFLWLSVLATVALAAPRWFPVTQGRFAEEVGELSEVDTKLAEFDQRLVETDREFQRVLADNEELRARLLVLDRMIDENSQIATENVKLTRGREREVSDWKQSLDSGGAWIMALVRALSGDPTALLGIAAGAAGIGGVASGVRQRKRADKYKGKAVQFAHCNGAKSREDIKHDPDFPEIT